MEVQEKIHRLTGLRFTVPRWKKRTTELWKERSAGDISPRKNQDVGVMNQV